MKLLITDYVLFYASDPIELEKHFHLVPLLELRLISFES